MVKNCSTCEHEASSGMCRCNKGMLAVAQCMQTNHSLWEQGEQQPITNLQKFAENITDEQFAALMASIGNIQCEELCPAFKDCNPYDNSFFVHESCYSFAKQWANSEVAE